ncbi:MAG: PIN domain-containing protein, partial [Candidatus Marinimicrobia bacterium]|nr:PIN domain-containing protein [Candidatus Neomarinimicrobiota bacterium]
MTPSIAKIFILDTNVILHDATCIRQFEENDIVIPISVLEELDQFKRGNEQIHYNAREFLRRLDEMSSDPAKTNGAASQESEGKIRVVVNHNWHKDVEASFQEDNPDHRIINCAYKLFQENRDRIV